MKRLVFITADNSGGVTDHTYHLANNLKKKIDVKIIKIKLNQYKIDPKAFKKTDVILLQYSGYGFAKRGAPMWLIREVKLLKKKVSKIIIFFHELYAYSYYPWKSAFWLYFFQKYIFKELANLADVKITGCEGYKKKLDKLDLVTKTHLLRTFSNVGELKKIYYKKSKTLVVFGLSRFKVYQKIGNILFKWAKKNNITIIDVGPKISDKRLIKELNFNDVKILGRLTKKNISNIFKFIKFGIVFEDINYIDKSSVFNTYVSHGIIPIVFNSKKKISVTHKRFSFLTSLPNKTNQNNKIIKINWNWYKKHDLNNCIKRLTKFF